MHRWTWTRVFAVWTTLWCGCVVGQTEDIGGQTGQPSNGQISGPTNGPGSTCQTGLAGGVCGPCWHNQQAIALGPDTNDLGSRWQGSYREPLYPIGSADPWGAILDAPDTPATELQVTLTRKNGPAQGFAACDAAAWAPMELSLRASDGSLDERHTVWLSVRTEQGTLSGAPDQPAPENVAFEVLAPNQEFLSLSEGRTLVLRGMLDGSLRGRVQGPGPQSERWIIHTACDGEFQLPLSERPTAPGYEGVPTPAAALAQIDGHRFNLRWSNGHESSITTRLRATSKTACWDKSKEPALRLNGLLTWVDQTGAQIAEARVILRASRFGSDWLDGPRCLAHGLNLGNCTVLRAWGGGFIQVLSSAATLPAGDVFGVESLDPLVGPDLSPSFVRGFARYSLDLKYEGGEFATLRLVFGLTDLTTSGAQELIGIGQD